MRTCCLLLLLSIMTLIQGCAPPTFGVVRPKWNKMCPEVQQAYMVSYYKYQNLGACSCKCKSKKACAKRYSLYNKKVIHCGNCGDRNCPDIAYRQPVHHEDFYQHYKPAPSYYQSTTSKAQPGHKRSTEEILSEQDLKKLESQEQEPIKPADVEKSLETPDSTTSVGEEQVPTTPTTGAPGIPTTTPTTGVPENVPVPSKKEVSEGAVESGAIDTTTTPTSTTTNGSTTTTTNGSTTNGSTTPNGSTPSTPTVPSTSISTPTAASTTNNGNNQKTTIPTNNPQTSN